MVEMISFLQWWCGIFGEEERNDGKVGHGGAMGDEFDEEERRNNNIWLV